MPSLTTGMPATLFSIYTSRGPAQGAKGSLLQVSGHPQWQGPQCIAPPPPPPLPQGRWARCEWYKQQKHRSCLFGSTHSKHGRSNAGGRMLTKNTRRRTDQGGTCSALSTPPTSATNPRAHTLLASGTRPRPAPPPHCHSPQQSTATLWLLWCRCCCRRCCWCWGCWRCWFEAGQLDLEAPAPQARHRRLLPATLLPRRAANARRRL